ncbi:MAG TPA: hypothetical protein VG122_25930 [Gemmata sp.]|jgi:hypothetical protein|nr:hypothetical protein [Gemmata sp.]
MAKWSRLDDRATARLTSQTRLLAVGGMRVPMSQVTETCDLSLAAEEVAMRVCFLRLVACFIITAIVSCTKRVEQPEVPIPDVGGATNEWHLLGGIGSQDHAGIGFSGWSFCSGCPAAWWGVSFLASGTLADGFGPCSGSYAHLVARSGTDGTAGALGQRCLH